MMNLTLAGLLSLAILNGATGAPADLGFYAKTMTVVDVDEDTDIGIAEDATGNLWEFDGIEDLYENDGISVLMCDNGTPQTIYDDVIVDIRYSGFTY